MTAAFISAATMRRLVRMTCCNTLGRCNAHDKHYYEAQDGFFRAYSFHDDYLIVEISYSIRNSVMFRLRPLSFMIHRDRFTLHGITRF